MDSIERFLRDSRFIETVTQLLFSFDFYKGFHICRIPLTGGDGRPNIQCVVTKGVLNVSPMVSAGVAAVVLTHDFYRCYQEDWDGPTVLDQEGAKVAVASADGFRGDRAGP